MKKISNAAELKEYISELELRRDQEKQALKDHIIGIKESLRPVNLLRQAAAGATEPASLTSKVIGSVLGLAVGYLTKKAVFGKAAANPIKKIAGTLLQMGVAGTISKNSDSIASMGSGLLRFFRRKRKEAEPAD